MDQKTLKKVNILLKSFHKLSNLIENAALSQELSGHDLLAVERDRCFPEFAIKALASIDSQEINELWSQVQHLSQFFGGDYLRYYKPDELEGLLGRIFDQTLEVVCEIRKHDKK